MARYSRREARAARDFSRANGGEYSIVGCDSYVTLYGARMAARACWSKSAVRTFLREWTGLSISDRRGR